jgi:uncharacterized membrane protein YebE (DUF533 family)
MFDASRLLDDLMGAGAASRHPLSGGNGRAAPSDLQPGMRQGEVDKPVAGGGFASVIRQVLGQATSGLKEAARDVEARTGLGGKVNDSLKQATGGEGAGDLLAQARDLASQNKLATGAVIGGLAGLLLGTGTGRGIAATTAKLGGLAVIGGLAYKALQNYQAGKPLIDLGGGLEPAPAESPLGNTADVEQDNKTAMLMVRAMIAAASADGLVDSAERSRIVSGLERAGLDVDAARFLDQEFAHPTSVEALVMAASAPAIAMQVYTAARIALELDHASEQEFLARLAAGLKLQPDLVANIDAAARDAQRVS